MNDRDRLAADLHDIVCDPRLTFDCEVDHDAQADRLVALGWTRLPTAANDRTRTFVVPPPPGPRPRPSLPPSDPALVGTEYGPVPAATDGRQNATGGNLIALGWTRLEPGPVCRQLLAAERERIRAAVKARPVFVLPTGTFIDVEYVFDAIDPEADDA